MGVDHLILAVEGRKTGDTEAECVRYNNYYSYAMECGGPGECRYSEREQARKSMPKHFISRFEQINTETKP